MANWSLPALTDLYTNLLTYLKGRDDDAVRLNDSRSSSASNLPDNAKRWNNTTAVFENWLSSVWSAIVLAVAGGGTGASTAAGARTNLGVPSVAEASATAQGLVDTHNAVTSPHGAVSAATALKLMVRDAAGRVAIATPSASGDAATKGYVDSTAYSGGHVPSLTNISNLASVTSSAAYYIRVGNIVHVGGVVSVLHTAWPDQGTRFLLSIPIAATFINQHSIKGHCVIGGGTAAAAIYAIPVLADTGSNKADIQYTEKTNGATLYFQYSYQV